MSVSRAEVESTLASRDPRVLAAVLDAADVRHPAGADGPELARRLAGALWWRSHSPAGQVLAPDTLDDMVDRTARRLDLDLGKGDAWVRLDALTARLLPGDRAVSVDDLDPAARQKLAHCIAAELFGTGAAGTAFGARWIARLLLGWTKGPLWDLLLLLPKVGPILLAVRGGAGTVAAVSGPVGVLLALLTLNQALGPRYDKALPLLLGAGLACRNPVAER